MQKKMSYKTHQNINKLSIFLIGSININTNNNAVIKNGPKGISLLDFLIEQYKAYGKAKKLPTTNDTNARRTPNTNPNIVISFISPPPIDSCLNALSPNNLTIIININRIKPLTKEIINVLKPK